MLLWFSVLGNWLGFSTGLVTVIIGRVVYITPFALVIVAVQVYGFDDTLVKVVPSADRNLTAALTRKPEPTKAAKPAKSPARPDKKAGPEPPPPTTNPDPKPTSPDLIRPF